MEKQDMAFVGHWEEAEIRCQCGTSDCSRCNPPHERRCDQCGSLCLENISGSHPAKCGFKQCSWCFPGTVHPYGVTTPDFGQCAHGQVQPVNCGAEGCWRCYPNGSDGKPRAGVPTNVQPNETWPPTSSQKCTPCSVSPAKVTPKVLLTGSLVPINATKKPKQLVTCGKPHCPACYPAKIKAETPPSAPIVAEEAKSLCSCTGTSVVCTSSLGGGNFCLICTPGKAAPLACGYCGDTFAEIEKTAAAAGGIASAPAKVSITCSRCGKEKTTSAATTAADATAASYALCAADTKAATSAPNQPCPICSLPTLQQKKQQQQQQQLCQQQQQQGREATLCGSPECIPCNEISAAQAADRAQMSAAQATARATGYCSKDQLEKTADTKMCGLCAAAFPAQPPAGPPPPASGKSTPGIPGTKP